MIFGSTKSRLDHIIENGCKRIDDAVEGVIDRYAPITTIDPSLNFEFTDESISVTTEKPSYEFPFSRVSSEAHRAAQRIHNFRLSQQVEMVAMARAQDWDGWRDSAMAQLQGNPNHCHAGMAAQKNPMANAYRQGFYGQGDGVNSFFGGTW